MEAVKRQILIAIGQLNVPVNRAPTKQKIDEACSAAKLLRNRLVREHCRVVEKLSTLHQQQCYDESSDDDNWEDRMHGGQTQIKGSTSRSEFIFVCELLLTEKVIIPLLLAHGLSYPETLLPQLLKLLAALLLPVPRFSDDRILQTDCLRHIKSRCGTDEFFSLVVQCAAPIAERRSKDLLRREDAVLLEVILTLVKNLLSGKPSDSELIHGSFCRSNGVELLLVVVNQNFSKMNSFQRLNEDISTNSRNVTPKGQSPDPVHAVEKMEGNVVELSDDECSATNERQSAAESESDHDEIENKSERSSLAAQLLHQQFAERVSGLLESKTQIWKWNSLILASMSNILGCVSSSELAQLCVLTETSDGSADGLPAVLRQKAHFKECRKSSENWRNIARSRNGAVNSSGIIVKSDPTMGDTRSLGTVSSLYGTKRKDPLEIAKEMDLRKRGRFVKGMYQQDQVLSACSLPLPTKLMLSQQCQSFVCFGFEPLSSMSWNYVSEAVDEVERATKEYKELVSGYRGSGENMEVISAFDGALFEKVATALDYFRMCGTLLHYIREVAQLLPRHDERPLLTIPSFQRQWQGASSIISLDHVDGAFRLLRSILQCKDLRRRCHLGDCLEFLIEILLLLHWLLDGDMGRDPAVAGAARALASSVLYKEENIKVVFDILSEFASRNVPKNLANKCTLFTFAVLQLMDRCGYQGSLLLPKKRPNARRGGDTGVVGEAFEDDGHDGDSIDSDTLKEREAEDAAELQGMIDDDDDDDRRDPNHLSGGEEVTQAPDTEETDVKELNDSNTLFADRAVSEEHPPTVLSVATSGHTMISTGSSERTVPIGSYVRRLASAKNCTVLLATLRGWRVNEAEVNLGLTFLMERLVAEGCESVFFNFAFLLVAREVLAYGEATHGPLYRVCDRIIYDFFNPPYAHMMDNRAATNFGDDHQLFLNGAQSFLGFEVALRCARALFYCSPTDYSILEERGQPQLVEHTAIPLVSEVALAGDDVVEWLPVPPAGVDPLLEPKPKRRRRHRRSPEAAMAIEEFS